jgi:hypothetical protein
MASQELSFAQCGKKERYLLPYGSGRNPVFIVSFSSQCIASNFFYCGIRDELLARGSCSKTEKHLTMRINMARFLPPGALESSGATRRALLNIHWSAP